MKLITDKIKENLAYPASLMGIVTLIVCSLLMVTDNLTAEPIAQRQKEDLTKLLDQVLPSELYDNQPLDQKYQVDIEGHELSFYRAKLEDKVSAIILFTKSAGYSGDISLIVAITAEGKVSGVRVLSHTETPGLGDKIELPKSDWILSFNGLSLSQPDSAGWAVKKDGGQFDAFTGATITPRAVIKGVYITLQQLKENKAFFLQTNESESATN
ncbi:electron transport complex subunit RsxG [Psychromonas sp. KJ10-10]|uniref:electron transport complex subunit RsxG n=1 Tax=Psychromonas sp. KJ10-10 TaxID=3391823 RepID=UPI0039B4E970